MDPAAPQSTVISITSNRVKITGSYKNVWNNCNISISDEKHQVLRWLSPLTSLEKHQAVRHTRAEGVGDWLPHRPEFSAWSTADDRTTNPILFCYGNPGVGKTCLSSLVIDTLSAGIEGCDVAVTCVYCDFSTQNLQSASTVLGSVLAQVIGALREFPDEVLKACRHAKNGGCGPGLPEILEMLINSLSNLNRSFICIDALDEFPPKHRSELWESLQRVVRDCPKTRLFLTGRPHMLDEVRKYFPETAEMLSINPNEHDIELYLKMRLRRDTEPEVMNEKLRADILNVIQKKVSGIFLLACINMDAILAEATINGRRQALHKMTKGHGLQEAYSTALDRIREQSGSKSKLGMEALMWISHSERPLRLDELCHALGVESGAGGSGIREVPLIRTILGRTLGLLKIDEKTSTVHLLHHTLQEYIGQHPTLFATPRSMMAEICLTYLNSRSVCALPASPGMSATTAPFLEYAACYWGTHAAREMTESTKSLALQLLGRYENHVSAGIFYRNEIDKLYFRKDIQGFNGLHYTAYSGIAEIANAMLEMKRWDVNGRDSCGETPLLWAVKCGHDSMVELFLKEEDIEPDAVTQNGRTVLSFAVEWGNEGAVKLLLERGDVNPNSPDAGGRTPLSLAVELGNEGAMKLLLERGDVNPNSLDAGGRTPLSIAVELENESAMKLLLERGDVDPNLPDASGRTPLSHAVELGNEGAMKLLLERGDVNPNSPDAGGRMPLPLAVESGSGGAVKLLLERWDVDTNSLGNDGLTPLSCAARDGREVLVQLLLERWDVNPNSSDANGRPPLSYAVMNGREGVVKLLLERRDVNPNSSDNHGLTPLSYAARDGREDLVQLLLEGGGFNPNSLDDNGRPPLSYAAMNGREDVVKLLLECKDVNPNSSGNNGRSPLSFAAMNGRDGVVKLLLEHRDTNPDLPDSRGQTPLSLAASRGHKGVMKLLLEREDVNPGSPDNDGITPLSYATMSAREGVVRLLLETRSSNYESSQSHHQTLISDISEELSYQEVTHPLIEI